MFDDLTPAQFDTLSNDDDQWQLLDVREEWEIAIASISTAILIPMMEIPSRLAELDKKRPVAVICHSGGRSGRVADFLSQQGFARVANIVGGIDAWTMEVDSAVPRY